MTPHDAPLLVVDDDVAIREFVSLALQLGGYEVVFAGDGSEVAQAIDTYHPRLVIMDVSMPGLNGLAALRELRAMGSGLPIIMLTALGADEDKLAAFEAGADDYLVKPFSARELVARVAAVLRRTGLAETDAVPASVELRAGPLTLVPETQAARMHDLEIELTPIEYALLLTLARSPGRIFTPTELLIRVWGQEYRDQAEILHTNIMRLRHKLEDDPHQPRYLRQRTGLGYYFATD